MAQFHQKYRKIILNHALAWTKIRIEIGMHRISIARLAQSVEHETLNLRVVGSSPTLGAYIFFFFFTFPTILPDFVEEKKSHTAATRDRTGDL